MFCEDNKLPRWGGSRHIVNVAILSFLKMVKEKEKLALFISHCWVEIIFFIKPTPLNIGAIVSNAPFFSS